MEIIWIDTGYAYGGITVKDGIVTRAPPIFRWMVGRDIKEVLKWRKIKGWGKIMGKKGNGKGNGKKGPEGGRVPPTPAPHPGDDPGKDGGKKDG